MKNQHQRKRSAKRRSNEKQRDSMAAWRKAAGVKAWRKRRINKRAAKLKAKAMASSWRKVKPAKRNGAGINGNINVKTAAAKRNSNLAAWRIDNQSRRRNTSLKENVAG